MASQETKIHPSFVMFVDTTDQSAEVRSRIAASEDTLRVSDYLAASMKELGRLMLMADQSDLVAQDPLAFHDGFDRFIEEQERPIMIMVTGDSEAIRQSLAKTAIPEEMKVTYPPLPEPVQ